MYVLNVIMMLQVVDKVASIIFAVAVNVAVVTLDSAVIYSFC